VWARIASQSNEDGAGVNRAARDVRQDPDKLPETDVDQLELLLDSVPPVRPRDDGAVAANVNDVPHDVVVDELLTVGDVRHRLKITRQHNDTTKTASQSARHEV
jgi:hypothetical protein